MPFYGKLIHVKVGNKMRFRVESDGKVLDFDADSQLSRALKAESPEAAHGRAVEFAKARNGRVLRVAEQGLAWEDPREPAVKQEASHARQRVTEVTPAFQVDGAPVGSRDIDICERRTALGRPVDREIGKWRRVDYFCENPSCYPYNFVRAPRQQPPVPIPIPRVAKSPEKRRRQKRSFFAAHPQLDHGRFAPGTHTGVIEVELTALSPLIISHPPGNDGALTHEERATMDAVYQAALGTASFGATEIDGVPDRPRPTRDEKMQRIRPPFQRADGRYILPATALKGMIRSMVEAYSNSLMGVVSSVLSGLDNEGRAQIRSRTNWRWAEPQTGITGKNHVTLYTYRWTGNTWARWVPKGNAPYDKLQHVNPDKNPLGLTLADAMFGRIFDAGSKHEGRPLFEALRGRVRVSDAEGWDGQGVSTATAADGYWFLKPLTRPSGAKAKCEALYLLPDASGGVAKYEDAVSEARGRKMYWPHSLGGPGQAGARSLAWMRDKIDHAKASQGITALWQGAEFAAALSAFRDRVKGERNSQPSTKSWVRPLLPGSTFSFTVRFEHLTGLELGALLKAIELANIPGKPITHCHRLGRAKPLGFGSVALRAKRIRLWAAEAAYTSLVSADCCWCGDEATSLILTGARNEFERFCAPWVGTAWEDIHNLTGIPDDLTDRNYWKNWSDYQPWQNKQHPLPLPKHARS